MTAPSFFRSASALAIVVALLGRAGGAEPDKPPEEPRFSAEQLTFYEKDVLPLLKARCYECHGEGKIKGGLRLTMRASILDGGDSGPAVSLDKPDESRLWQAINYKGGLEMPPKGKLPPKEIDTLSRWLKVGLPMPAGALTKAPAAKGGIVTPESKNYWAYKPLQRPSVPEIRSLKSNIRNPIDNFILAQLEEKGLTPTPPADRVALIRRVTYDLTGLPPAAQEVDIFVKDSSPNAYEKVVDRLLASPHYGEKWGRHWLDLVRYAETNGYERDGPKPYAWRYRDYVIKSFNDDKPYDQFIREQLAGDEVPGYHPDAVIATGYYRLGLWDDEPADPAQARYDELDDIVATTAQVFLGMTMNCARCHDHKIDPIPQSDYYRLLAFFQDVKHYSNDRHVASSANMTDITPPERRSVYEVELKQREVRLAELARLTTAIEDEAIKKMPAEDQRAAEGIDRPQVVEKVPLFLDEPKREEYRKLRRELERLKTQATPSQVLALSVNRCLVSAPETHVLIRGSPHAPGARVEPGFPQVLGASDPHVPQPSADAKTSGRRGVLAGWIAAKDNQLTARVMANRLWQHHFGRGIVASSNDFGRFGTPPTHPELLDWLACEFIDGGWRIKRMHKLILMSSAYQMSSQANAAGLQADPANQLFWRFNMRRLTAEEVRDSTLMVSGKFNPKMGGASIYPPIPREVLAGQSRPGEGWGDSPPDEAARRSVYVHVKRSLLVPILSHHDQADTDSSCPVRYTTTVPTQALGMLNGDFTNEQAAAFAERLRQEAPDDLAAQVRRAIRLTTGRCPAEDEVKKDVAFIVELRKKARLTNERALEQYCLMQLNTNEFVYLD
jgi:Protein of unknown function (DUF1549)/Protein of unknown function (DUF1553)/Planctomycete cytochrome C